MQDYTQYPGPGVIEINEYEYMGKNYTVMIIVG